MRISDLTRRAETASQPQSDGDGALDDFLEIYSRRPIRDNSGGMKSVGMFAVYSLLQKINPLHVIESGIWKGQSTWLIEQALPQCSIVSLDPNLGLREYLSPRAVYSPRDFLSLDAAELGIAAGPTLVFFDDHQDALPRLIHCAEIGIRDVIFDDNYPEYCGQRHRTVSALLHEKKLDGSPRFPAEKAELETLLERCEVFPPLFDFDEPITGEKTRIGIPSLLGEYIPQRHGRWEHYWKEMSSYRWTTFVRLR